MSRVRAANFGWGVVLDTFGNIQTAKAVTLTDLDGAPVSLYAATSGGTTVTAVTNSRGEIPGYIEPGSYLLTVGDLNQVQVEAAAGGQSNVELGYVEITSNVVLTLVSNTEQYVTGLDVTVTIGDRPVMVEVFSPLIQHATTTANVSGRIMHSVNGGTDTLIGYGQTGHGRALIAKCRDAPAVGASVRYRAQLISATSGNATMWADPTFKSYISIVEI